MTADALIWPAHRFYWAVLAPRRRSGRRPTQAQLRFLLEPLVPEPIDGVHAVFHDLEGGRVLAVGLPHEALREIAASGALSLRPASVPVELGCDTGPEVLQLLEGAAAPVPVTRHRRMRRTAACASLLLGLACVATGVQRRVLADDALVAALADVRAGRVRTALGAAVPSNALPPELALAAEIRSLQRTRAPESAAILPVSVAPALAAVMSSWPQDCGVRLDSIHATGSQLTLRGRAGTASQVDALARTLGEVPGWRAAQPSVREARGEAAFTLRIEEASP